MKKLLLGMLVGCAVAGLAFSVYATEIKEKTTVKTKGDTTVEKTEVRGGGVKAKEEVRTTPTSTTTKQEMKTKDVEMKKETVETDTGVAGKAKFKLKHGERKHGAIKDWNVKWVYFREGPEYIIEYEVKDRTDPELLKDLNLTKNEASLLKSGRVVSTSPYTANDVKADFRRVIRKNIELAIAKRRK